MIHGKVEINDKPIFGWQAIRTDTLFFDEPVYACEVYDYASKETVRFNVAHTPADGASVLVSKIWTKFITAAANLTS